MVGYDYALLGDDLVAATRLNQSIRNWRSPRAQHARLRHYWQRDRTPDRAHGADGLVAVIDHATRLVRLAGVEVQPERGHQFLIRTPLTTVAVDKSTTTIMGPRSLVPNSALVEIVTRNLLGYWLGITSGAGIGSATDVVHAISRVYPEHLWQATCHSIVATIQELERRG